MFNRFFGAAFAALLLILSLPLLAWTRLRTRRPAAIPLHKAALGNAASSIEPPAGGDALPAPLRELHGSGSGAAFAACEELIDSTCGSSNTLHVAMLVPTLNRVAVAERQLLLLAMGLRRRGWSVTVITLAGSGGVAAEELREAGVHFVSLGMRTGLADPRGWARFLIWLWHQRPDIVHAHLPQAGALARWARLFAPVPVLIDTLRSPPTDREVWRLGYRLSRGLPDQVTAVSRSVAESHLAARTVCRATLSILPDAVDVDAWLPDVQGRAQLRRELGMHEDEFLWLAVGRLERGKDYPTLLRALAAIPPSARLVVAGGGPLLKALAHLATYLGLRERVTFLGFGPDLLRWFQAADGLVHTLRCDGMPATLLRAAACALPVVATDLPGAREIVLDEETGMLVPAADAAALASAMTSIVRMPAEERLRMGASARRRAIEHFSLTACVSRWEELYGTLLRRKERNVAVQRVTAPGFPARIRSQPAKRPSMRAMKIR